MSVGRIVLPQWKKKNLFWDRALKGTVEPQRGDAAERLKQDIAM
jgi:hypothetical protein